MRVENSGFSFPVFRPPPCPQGWPPVSWQAYNLAKAKGYCPCWEKSLVWVGVSNGSYVMTVSLSCTLYLWTWHCFAGMAGVHTLRWVHSPHRKYSSWPVWTQLMMDSSRNNNLWWMNSKITSLGFLILPNLFFFFHILFHNHDPSEKKKKKTLLIVQPITLGFPAISFPGCFSCFLTNAPSWVLKPRGPLTCCELKMLQAKLS